MGSRVFNMGAETAGPDKAGAKQSSAWSKDLEMMGREGEAKKRKPERGTGTGDDEGEDTMARWRPGGTILNPEKEKLIVWSRLEEQRQLCKYC